MFHTQLWHKYFANQIVICIIILVNKEQTQNDVYFVICDILISVQVMNYKLSTLYNFIPYLVASITCTCTCLVLVLLFMKNQI